MECALFTCMVLRLFVLWRLRVLAGPASRKERVEMKATIIFLGFAQYIPYFISMFRGRTRPSVSGWLCFALSLFVTLVASLFMGSISILVSCGMGLMCQIFIIVAGVRQGSAFMPSRMEIFVLWMVAFSGVAWFASGDASVAIYVNLIAEVAGTFFIFLKTLRHPMSEALLTWGMGLLGSGLAVIHFSDETGANYVYLLNVFLSNLMIVGLLLYQRFAPADGKHGV